MTRPALHSSVHFFDARDLRLVEAPPPQLSAAHQQARDELWEEAVKANPALFDGPVVACARAEQKDPDTLVLHWTRVTYRHYALRWVPGAASLPALFVAILQPTEDGALLAGRMSSSTIAPGRWQLPGGSVDAPDDGEQLSSATLRKNAARELAEETGVDAVPDDLELWAASRGKNGNIGILYKAPPQPRAVLHERYATVAATEHAAGSAPEFDEIDFLYDPTDLKALSGPRVDFLAPVVHRYLGTP
ncbi:NUDIX hydrolase [Streptomyces hygroscopicus]|uniref:NUDIX domain-containing protein n=1 Tax=Streptomyces hygroscopicus TaxID=1912 RepID=UPI00223F8577|nr:NUDIX domain-containing protein [Streptomyces hygroscopicus]MCW7940548.1 NUDIX hydrolase [Streptomyces hygroscopicus]